MKLTKRKDGRWQTKLKLPDGKTKYFYSSELTERKAENDINRQVLNYQHIKHQDKHNFKIIADKMLKHKETEVGYSTNQTYKYSLQYLSDLFDCDIEEITPLMLQKTFESLQKKGYSYSAIGKAKTTFGLVINYAIVYENLPVINFTKDVKIPKNIVKPKIHAPDDAVIEQIISNAQTSFFGMWAMILLCTGIRRGELAALQRRDIDFDKSEIHIWRSVEFVNNQARLKDIPKTANSIRTIPILGMLYKPLQIMCKDIKPSDFVFGGEKPLSETAIKKRWKKYCAESEVNIHQHQLRHAYAKILYRAGVDAKTAQGLLGHANINITMDIYTDFSDEMNKKSLLQIDTFMSGNFAQNGVTSVSKPPNIA